MGFVLDGTSIENRTALKKLEKANKRKRKR
jgi:hypothetical protein